MSTAVGEIEGPLRTFKNQPEGKCIIRNADKLTLSGGMLYYWHCPKYLAEIKQFVVPRAHRRTALNGCHRDASHQGKKQTLSLVADRFWWPGVQEAADCKHCQVYGGSESKAPMVSLKVTTHPLQLMHLDFTLFESMMELDKTPEVKNILVTVDHFMRYMRAYVTKDQKASTVAKCLYEGFIFIFGTPEKIITDQGKAFTSDVVTELCNQFGVGKTTMTPYHSQGNGQVKQAHQALGNMIGKLEDGHKKQWPRHLAKLTHAYNLTRSLVTCPIS